MIIFNYEKNNVFKCMYMHYEEQRVFFFALLGLTLTFYLSDSDKDADYQIGFWFTPEHLYVKNKEFTYFWDYPFITYNYVNTEYYTSDYNWKIFDQSFHKTDENGLTLYPNDIYQFNVPFTFVPKTGQLQECDTRTVFKRMNYTRKWFPFLKKSFYRYNVDFSQEMDNNVDSWKGGTLNLSAQLTTSIQYFENNFQSIVSNSL